MRLRLLIAGFAALVLLIIALVYFRTRPTPLEQSTQSAASGAASTPATTPSGKNVSARTSTNIYAHNLMLRKGPNFRVYVRWLRGKMTRAKRNVDPSFDDPESFFLDIQAGVLRANVGDLTNFLNAGGLASSPLKNISLSGDGEKIKLTGTLHKVIPLPIELRGTIAAVPDNRIQLHITKINVLKIPFKAILGGLNVRISDLFQPGATPGVQVSGNDIFFDTQQLLPPPHIRGHLTAVRVVNPDLEEVYGQAEDDVARVEQWRNFLRLSGGSIDFGRLTMHNVDLVMVDISKDAWFDLDLNNYQAQLVNGYTRMTPQAGLQIFMPDLDQVHQSKANQNISIEWMKNRNSPPPADVISK